MERRFIARALADENTLSTSGRRSEEWLQLKTPKSYGASHRYAAVPEDAEMDDDAGHTDGDAAPVPWAAILSSRPVWALIVASMANNFSFYMLLSCLPLYMVSVVNRRPWARARHFADVSCRIVSCAALSIISPCSTMYWATVYHRLECEPRYRTQRSSS
jgi:hypothetical protein